jgi:signal transduction histidine kinase
VTGEDVAARADAELLREVLLNLLINAGQAMEGRGTVRVTIAAGAMAKVRVIDAGPGLPVELGERIFEPFFTTKRSGTGLGLAIVRRLLELQNGAVEVESSSPRGTTMSMTLPAEPAPRPSSRATSRS